MMDLRNEVANIYGKTKPASIWARRVCSAVEVLRSELDNQCCRDCPAEFSPKIYYGEVPLHRTEPAAGAGTVRSANAGRQP